MIPADVAAKVKAIEDKLSILKSHGVHMTDYREVGAAYQDVLYQMADAIRTLANYLEPEHVVVKSNN